MKLQRSAALQMEIFKAYAGRILCWKI